MLDVTCGGLMRRINIYECKSCLEIPRSDLLPQTRDPPTVRCSHPPVPLITITHNFAHFLFPTCLLSIKVTTKTNQTSFCASRLGLFRHHLFSIGSKNNWVTAHLYWICYIFSLYWAGQLKKQTVTAGTWTHDTEVGIMYYTSAHLWIFILQSLQTRNSFSEVKL